MVIGNKFGAIPTTVDGVTFASRKEARRYHGHAWAPHEILWLEAALGLRVGPRNAAFRDIASMSGRSLNAVRTRAAQVKKDRQEAAVRAAWSAQNTARIVMVPERYVPNQNMARSA